LIASEEFHQATAPPTAGIPFAILNPIVTMAEPASIPILNLRGLPVLIDADLARLYGVPTRALNQAVCRNTARLPDDFLFQLTESEKAEVITNYDHLQNLKFSKALPRAFTEHGALMVANVLNSAAAVKMSVFIIRAFIKQREALSANATILKRLAEIGKTLLLHPARSLPKTPPAAATSAGQTPSAHRLRKAGRPMTVELLIRAKRNAVSLRMSHPI
jgi:hypothetical protein